MFLNILPDLDMPLNSLDTKNYYPTLNSLGDMAIAVYKALIPFFLGRPVVYMFLPDIVQIYVGENSTSWK